MIYLFYDNTLCTFIISHFRYILSINSSHCFEWNFLTICFIYCLLCIISDKATTRMYRKFGFDETTSWHPCFSPYNTTFYPRFTPAQPRLTLDHFVIPFYSLYPINTLYPKLSKYPNFTNHTHNDKYSR